MQPAENVSMAKTKISYPTDIHDKGFTTVYEAETTPKFDIVLIHGLQGHPYKTWAWRDASKPSKRLYKLKEKLKTGSSSDEKKQNAEKSSDYHGEDSKYWPVDLLPVSFPTSRILVYGYDSHVSHFFSESASKNNIFTLGRDFLLDLAAQRSVDSPRPLIFMAHSLGGLVVKDALRRAHNAISDKEQDLASVLSSTVAVMFFGTPHRGSAYASIGLTATRIVSMAGFSVNDENVRNLKGNSGVLEILREEFVRIMDTGAFWASTFQESTGPTKSSFADRKIVDIESSGLDHRCERKFTLSHNHMDMCRFRTNNDPDYEKVASEVSRHLNRCKSEKLYRKKEYLESLYVPEMYYRIEEIDVAYSTTLGWLLNNGQDGPGFIPWLEDGTQVFWITGKPGSGKSTATKYLFIQSSLDAHLKMCSSGSWAKIGLFFTDRGDEMQRSWFGVLSAMLHDLLCRVPDLTQLLINWLAMHETSTPSLSVKLTSNDARTTRNKWTVDLLQRALLFCKFQKSVVFRTLFFIDALDEHEGTHREMGEYLKLLAQVIPEENHNIVKICVSSRPYNELKDLFDQCPGFHMHEWTEKDIRTYATGRLMGHRRMQNLVVGQESQGQAQRLINRLIQRAQGVFLWVRLVIDELETNLTDGIPLKNLLGLIEDLPDELNAFFLRMLQKIPPKYQWVCYVILETVICSHRPTTKEQLDLSIKANVGEHSASYELSDDAEGFGRQLTTYTGGLLETPRHRTSSIKPIHQTIKEFLQRPQNLQTLLSSKTDAVGTRLGPGVDGHFFLLRASEYYLKRASKVQLMKFFDFQKICDQIGFSSVIYERRAKKHCYPLLSELDTLLFELNASGIRPPLGLLLRSVRSFLDQEEVPHAKDLKMAGPYLCNIEHGSAHLAFAAATNMASYVESALVSKRAAMSADTLAELLVSAAIGSPFYLVNRPDEDVLDVLLDYGAKVDSVNNKVLPGTDALGAFIISKVEHGIQCGRPILSTINKLIDHGGDPNGKILSETAQRPLLHHLVNEHYTPTMGTKIIELPIRETFQALQLLVERGANVNSKDSLGLAFIEAVFEWRPFTTTEHMWTWFLEHGAKITKRIATSLYEDEKFKDHLLLTPALRKIGFYDSEARIIAWKHNPSWWGLAGTSKHHFLSIKDRLTTAWK